MNRQQRRERRDGLEVARSWGFEYVTKTPWIKLTGTPQIDLWGEWTYKPAWGTGFWVRGCSEDILICRRGSPSFPVNPPLGLVSERFEHSRKPDNLYEYAELFPGPYLELFARRARDGWDTWGNEVERTIALEKEIA